MSPGRAERGPRGPRRIVAAWALATLAALAGLDGAPGLSRDEAAVVAPARRGAALLRDAAPPLAPVLSGTTHLAARTWIPHVRAARLGTALAGALLSALLAWAAWSAAGPAAALLAPALFWLAPRTLHAGLVATPEIALAALALAAVLAWRRSFAARSTAEGLWAAALAGLLLGAAILARADAWTLAPALALHAALRRLLAGRTAPPEAPAPRGGALAKLGALGFAAAATVVVAWPGVLRAAAGPWLPPAGGALAPLLVLAAVPAPLLWAFGGGLAHAAVRTVVAFRTRAGAAGADDALLALTALAALAGSALSHAPAGARPFLHALPFAAVLGARALVRAAALAWPSRAGVLAAALALLVLYPGLRAAVVAFPDGAAAWNELVGGAAGAASRGLRRQDGGEAAAALLAAVNARAVPGARIWWPGVAPEAVALYARDGLLRYDLRLAAGPAEADLAVVPLDGGSRDAEYRAWSALRTARPAAGVYADEVPIAFVYARPGAWR